MRPSRRLTQACSPATDRERVAGDNYTRALSSPGCAELSHVLDEDAHFAFAGFNDARGAESVIHMHDMLFRAFTSRTFVTTRVLLTDNSQVVEWTMSAVHEATHKPVVLNGVALLWTKDDGSISDVHLYFDEALPKAQAGVGPKSLVAPPLPVVLSAPPQVFEQSRSGEETANVVVVREWLSALENNDEPGYLTALTEDFELYTLEAAKPGHGRPDARAYYASIHRSIAQLDTSIDNIWGIGNFVVVEYHTVGEQRGALSWVPAQRDNLLKMFTVDVVEMRGGKIARIWRYDNPTQILTVSPRAP